VSTFDRAKNIARAYVNEAYDRARGVDIDAAWKELKEAVDVVPREESTSPSDSETVAVPSGRSQEELARAVLGVSPTASFEEIQKVYETLSRRSDPTRFPDGSTEQRQAAELQKKITAAYNILTANVDATEKRFRSLEI
jgi:hypothetical protein